MPLTSDDVWDCIKEQSDTCGEKYVFEKSFWRRGITLIVIILGLLLTAAGTSLAWGFKTSAIGTANTEGRRHLENDIVAVKRINKIILEQNKKIMDNQEKLLQNQQSLNRYLGRIYARLK